MNRNSKPSVNSAGRGQHPVGAALQLGQGVGEVPTTYVSGAQVPVVIEPGALPLCVGRDPGCDIKIPHTRVSRRHAVLVVREGRILVQDQKAQWGTTVNGVRVRQGLLKEGDRVGFGPILYCVRNLRLQLAEEAHVPAEPAGEARVRLALCTHNLCFTRIAGIDWRTLNWRKTPILQGVNLAIRPGRFVGLLGPSGSGKTTLLRCLAGLLPPTAGQVLFENGYDMAECRSLFHAQLGYVPQDDLIHHQLTVWENLDFALQLRGSADLQRGERREVLERVLEDVQLTAKANSLPRELSGGQRKRVNIALELVTRPSFLFLDEPTSGLDPLAERQIMTSLRHRARSGTTVICSTHVMESLDLFDQVLLVANGVLVDAGPAQDLKARSGASTFAAVFEHLIEHPPKPQRASSTAPRRRKKSATSTARAKLSTQIQVVARRGLKAIRRDRTFLLLLGFAQPVVLVLLIVLSQAQPTSLKPMFLFAIISSLWLGLNNTAREVIRDRALYAREQLAGLTALGYLGGKGLLFALVGLGQVALLVFILRKANLLQDSLAQELGQIPVVYFAAVLWFVYLGGMLLGLLVSTLADSEEAAVGMLPLILLPQLLLTGVASGLHSPQEGRFTPLAVTVSKMKSESRPAKVWALEVASLATYSRPAFALLQPASDQPNGQWDWLADGVHLLLLLTLNVLALIWCFAAREQKWAIR